MKMFKQPGFTLIELMITVAIIAILSGIALPAYSIYVLKAARAEAKAALLDVAAKQEQFYLDNKGYTTNLTNLGYTSNPWTTESNRYVITIESADNVAYDLKATRTGAQLKDSDCGDFTYDSTGTKGVDDATSAASTCW